MAEPNTQEKFQAAGSQLSALLKEKGYADAANKIDGAVEAAIAGANHNKDRANILFSNGAEVLIGGASNIRELDKINNPELKEMMVQAMVDVNTTTIQRLAHRSR